MRDLRIAFPNESAFFRGEMDRVREDCPRREQIIGIVDRSIAVYAREEILDKRALVCVFRNVCLDVQRRGIRRC